MLQKILLALSVIFMIASGGLGYMNKTKLAQTVTEKEDAESKATASASDADKAKKSLKDSSDKLTAESAKVTEMEQLVSGKEAELAKAAADVTNLTAQLTDKTAAYDTANAELEKLKAAGPGTKAAISEIAPAAEPSQVAELTAQIEALKSEKAIIGDKLMAAEVKTKELATVVNNAKNAIMAKGLEGQVIAVNQAWGFVVLNLGDRSGVVSNAEMVVMRDGDRVGKVKITSVEPSSSIADIVATTVADGQRVQPGDRVIYAGN